MRTLRAPKRVFLGVLALSLACTLTPIAPSYAAETNEAPLASGVKNAVIAEASQADQSAAQTDGGASAADASAADSAFSAVSAADQATASTQPSAGESAGADTGEAESAPSSAATASNTSASTAPVEIISGQVSLEDAAAARTLIQQNGLTFIDNTDGTATMVGWSGSAPQGELSIPAQVNGLAVTSIDFLAQVPLATDDLDLSDAARAVAESNAVAAAMQAPAVTRLSIPASVATINTASFAAFPGLVAIEVAADNQTYSSYNGMLFDEQLSHLHLVPEAMEGVAVLPASLATVPACVISRCTKLFGLDIPTGGAADAAFAVRNGILYAKNLTPSGTPDGTLTLLAAPMGIGTSTVIDASCTSIAEGAFWGNTALKTIVVKGTVDSIAAGSLAAAVAEGEEGAPINTAMPLGKDGTAWAALPAFSEEAPKNATVALMVSEVEHAFAKGAWEAAGFTHFADPAMPGDTAEADGFVFTLLDDFTLAVTYEGEAQGDITIPAQAELGGVSYGVTRIADAAFENQTGMTSVSIPESITSLGARAFAGCTSLASASLPGSVVSIGASAFSGCSALASVELHEGTTTISEGAFANTALTSIILPKTMRTISAAVFEDCAHLEQVLMLGDAADISSTALGNATGVKVYVPYSESGPLWPQLPASGNTVCEYGVVMPSDPIALTVGDEIYLPNCEGVSLHSAGDITISYTYKGYPVYVDTEGTVKAKTPGTAPVNVMLYLGPTLLAKATVSVVVQAAAEIEKKSSGSDSGGQENISEHDQGFCKDLTESVSNEESQNDRDVDSAIELSKRTNVSEITPKAILGSALAAIESFASLAEDKRQDIEMLSAESETRATTYYNDIQVHLDGDIGRVIQNIETGAYTGVVKEDKNATPSELVRNYQFRDSSEGENLRFDPGLRTFQPIVAFDSDGNLDNPKRYFYGYYSGLTRLNYSGWLCWVEVSGQGWKTKELTDQRRWKNWAHDWPEKGHLYLNGAGDFTLSLVDTIGNGSGSTTVKPYTTYTPSTPTATHYNFAGWYDAATGGNKVTSVAGTRGSTYKSNVTLYARWTPKSYTIKWSPGTGHWADGTTGVKETTVAYGSTPTAPATPSMTNTAQYTYGACVWSPKVVAVTGATTYTATYTSTVNKYTIKWSPGKGHWSDGKTDVKETSVAYGTVPAAPATPSMTNTAQYTYGACVWSPKVVAVTGATTYTATYTSTVNKYTIKWSPGAGHWADGTTGVKETSVAYGSTPTAPATPSRTNTTQFTYGPCVWSPRIVAVTGATTYTATYTETNNVYKVTLTNNNATTNGTSVLYLKYNVGWFSDSACAKAISSITTPKRTGYTFGGYVDVANAGGTITATKTAFAANASRDPIWNAINYSIGYNYNGGSVAKANPTTYTIESNAFTLTNPTKGGYTHNSWTVSGNSNITGGGVSISGTTAQVKKGTYGNLTFTAGYSANTYSITYDLKGGSISGEKTQYKTDDANFNLVNPTRRGYTFAGWTVTGASGTGIKVSGTTSTVQKETYGNLSCTANWTANTYTVTFDKNVGDTGDKVEPMPYAPEPFSFSIKFSEKDLTTPNDTVVIPNVIPKRTGYDFDGWKVEGPGIANNTDDYDATRIYQPGDTYRHPFDHNVMLYAQWVEKEGYHLNFYKFTEDGADDRIEFTPDYANLKYEDKFQLPGRGNVPDNDKVSGYYLYGWSWSREAGPDGSAQATTFVIPASATLDDRVSVRDILTALGGGTPEEPENAEINLYAVWQMVYSVSAPTSSDATGIVLDASEVAVYRPADITFTNTTPCEVAVGAYSEYDKAIFEGVFPNTRVRDVDFSFIEAGADEDSAKYFQLNGDALDDETWRRRLTRLSQGSAASPSTLDAQLSFDFNKSSVNISHELQEDADGILMNGKHWERPIARITWLLSPDETTALTYTLLPHMPAAGSAPGHGEVDLTSDSLPFVKDEG